MKTAITGGRLPGVQNSRSSESLDNGITEINIEDELNVSELFNFFGE